MILFSQCKSEEDYYEPLYQPEASHQLLLHAEGKVEEEDGRILLQMRTVRKMDEKKKWKEIKK